MFRFYIFITLLFLSFTNLSYADTLGENEFQAGVKHFKQNKYKLAIKKFNKAYSKGMRKNVLYFNMAVTHYKLNNYKKAKEIFKKLSTENKFSQISFYNLGLISEKYKHNDEAIKSYKLAVSNNQNIKITRLANTKLDALLKRNKRYTKKPKTYINLAFGSDDNISNTTTDSVSNKSDSYIKLFANIKAPISKDMNIKGSLMSIDYNNYSSENFQFYSAAIDKNLRVKKWKITPELAIIQSTYGGKQYQSTTDLKLSGNTKFKDASSLSLRYRYSNIHSQNALYSYLQGDRHQLRADYKMKFDFSRLRFRYQYEMNDRENTGTANYSPTRHTLRLRLKQRLSNNWKLSEEFYYRISHYGEALNVARSDNRTRLKLSANKKIKRNWSAGMLYSHTKNNSNIAGYNYSRNIIQLNSTWLF